MPLLMTSVVCASSIVHFSAMTTPGSYSCAGLTARAVAGVLLQIIGLFLFVFGFFPVKPTLHGIRSIRRVPLLAYFFFFL
jgi:hypothetical protein